MLSPTVQRGDYYEILSHEEGHCDLSRLNSGHPLLLNHDKLLAGIKRPEGKLRIAFWLGHQLEPWTPETLERDGMGGSETMAWEMSKRLARLGHKVTVFGHVELGPLK